MTSSKSNPNYWNELYNELNIHVVSGQHAIVKLKIDKIGYKSIPRNYASFISEIAWRISYPILALKILHPIVYPEKPFVEPATDKEKINYASALINLGAVDEALGILNTINCELEPEALLRKSFALFKKWDYKPAVPLLKDYIRHNQITPYKRVIGKVNLAAALIDQSDWVSSEKLLLEIESECRENGYSLLLGNCLELQAQVKIFQFHFSQAIPILNQAQEYLKNQNGSYSLFVEKWLAICFCFQNKNSDSLQSLKLIKKKSAELGNWESARECDLFEAIATDNQDLAKKVLLGTPHESYRQRIRRLYGKNIVSRGNFYLNLDGNGGPNPTKRFNPYESYNQSEALFKKPLLLSLFVALATDFYKPSHIGLLFQRIYPDERFNPFSSPDRILMLIKRLNTWFAGNEIPLRVRLKKSEFCLIAHGQESIQILVHRAKKLSKDDGYLVQLKTFFLGRAFTIKQVADRMGLSKTTSQALILGAIEAGQLKKLTTKRPILYQIVSKSANRAAA